MTSDSTCARRLYLRAGLFLLLLAALSVAGCGRNDEDDEILYALDGEPVEIAYVAPDFAFVSGPEQVAIERFQERAPGIEIDRRSLSRSHAGYLLDEAPPDVMLWWDSLLLRSAAQQGLLADLSDVWTENNLEEAYGDRFREISRFEGTLRFLPAGFSWAGIYYNKELFARYGLAPPANWEEFARICDTLLANGETPLTVAGQNPFVSLYWFDYLNLRLNGADFHRSLTEGRESYYDERVARVWETWISLLQRGYFVESPGQTSDIGSMNALIRGDGDSPLTREKAVMALAPHFSVSQMPPVFAAELDFFQVPLIDQDLPIGEISVVFGYIIPAGAANKVEASLFIGYMSSTEAQGLQMGRTDEDSSSAIYAPVHREVAPDLLPAAAQKGAGIVRDADEIMPPLFLALPDSMQAAFNSVLRRIFLRSADQVQVSELQATLEEARLKAIENGEYLP